MVQGQPLVADRALRLIVEVDKDLRGLNGGGLLPKLGVETTWSLSATFLRKLGLLLWGAVDLSDRLITEGTSVHEEAVVNDRRLGLGDVVVDFHIKLLKMRIEVEILKCDAGRRSTTLLRLTPILI